MFSSAGTAKYIRTQYDSRCADWHTGNNDMYMGGCHNGNNQKFYFESWPPPARIKSLHGDACLDWHTGNNNLYWGGCHNGWNQKFFFENPAQTTQGWADYCNQYQDLKNAFCGGQTCTTNNWWSCRTHCYQYGFTENRPSPYAPGTSCAGQFKAPKAESYGEAKRMMSPWSGSGDCIDMNLGSHTLFMHPCHGGGNQKFYLS
jgi:hypothetical protein